MISVSQTLSYYSFSLILIPTTLSLRCSICRHTGLSMVPPNARNSRFIFNAPTPNCLEQEIQCSDTEDFCLSAFTRGPEGKYWVQKGCVASASGGVGAGCSPQRLDLSQARHLPVKIPDRPLELTVCICNTQDSCNAGILSHSNSLTPIFTFTLLSAIAHMFLGVSL